MTWDIFKSVWIKDTEYHRRHKTKQTYQVYQGWAEASCWCTIDREEYFIELADHIKRDLKDKKIKHLKYRKALKYLKEL